ncbi:MAG TPA: type II secretion system F family protein [Polyangia bacterium]|jgi:tight adherence protein C|nr:type II secretion system F family protein [Polyangia bacterium]
MPAVASTLFGVNWELGAIALGVTALLVALAAAAQVLLAPQDGVVARIDRLVSRPEGEPTRMSREENRAAVLLGRLLRPLVALARPTSTDEISRLRSSLVRAGLRSERAMEIFLISKLVLAGAATMTFLNFNSRLPHGLRFPMVGAVALLVCGVAFFLPNIWLSQRTKGRQTSIERGLPDAMDLLVTCVEAGLGLDAALGRVAAELKPVAPLLAAELILTVREAQAGLPRREALRRLSERTGVDDLRELAAVLAQTEIFGTSIARALRIHADGMRTRRMQIAERKASMVGVKMTFPLIFCVLPSLMAVVLGPAIVSIAANIITRAH